MNPLVLSVLLGFATFRVARFLILDSMIARSREAVRAWIAGRVRSAYRLRRLQMFFWMKLYELIGCPWCLTVWVAGGAVIATEAVTSVPLPVAVWLATATVSLLPWRALDWDEDDEE